MYNLHNMLNIEKLSPSSSWILEDSNPLLSIKCKKTTFPLDKKDCELVNRMVNYIDACYLGLDEKYDIYPGIAVAAPQVGCDKQIIYVHFFDGETEHKYLLANPEIVATSLGMCYLKNGEGCLSVKKPHKGHVKRFCRIKVKALDMLNDNKEITFVADGILSICLQHEIDHLSGICFYQRIDKKHKYLEDNDQLIGY